MIPAIAMMAYITLETMLVAPPKMDATRSNSNSPTNPQFNAPTIVYLCLNKGYSKWSAYDLGALSMAIMLAAKDRGIDSIPAASVVRYPDILRKILKIPDDEDIIVGIALGYEEKCDANDYRANKFKIDELNRL